MITLTYTNPASDATHLTGAWQAGNKSGDFTLPIIYVDGVQDIDATVEKMEANCQQALDAGALLEE